MALPLSYAYPLLLKYTLSSLSRVSNTTKLRSGEVPKSPTEDPFVLEQTYKIKEIQAHQGRGRNR